MAFDPEKGLDTRINLKTVGTILVAVIALGSYVVRLEQRVSDSRRDLEIVQASLISLKVDAKEISQRDEQWKKEALLQQQRLSEAIITLRASVDSLRDLLSKEKAVR